MGGLQNRSLSKAKTAAPKRKVVDGVHKKAPGKAFKKRQAEKEKLKRIQEMQNALRQEIHAEQDRARASRKANALRKQENEKKSMVIQEIRNIRAVKKLTPKQRRRARICLRHEL
jgi:rRNA-processing protein CGR1